MSMIKVENLTFSYPTGYDNIFENVNFQIDTDWKLGFVGRNGRGKTTLLCDMESVRKEQKIMQEKLLYLQVKSELKAAKSGKKP